MEVGILDTLLQQFENIFTSGLGAVAGHAIGVLHACLFIDFVWAVLMAVVTGDAEFSKFVRKIIGYIFWIYIVTNYSTWINIVIDLFSEVGLAAGGGGIGTNLMKHPSLIIDKGFELTHSYLTWARETNTGIWAFFSNFDALFWVYLGAVAIIAAFIFLAFQIFITYIEFYVFALLAVFFIAFAVWNKSAWISEKVIGGVVSYGVKLMFMATILSALSPIINTFTVDVNGTPKFDELVASASACWLVGLMAWQAPSTAAGLMTGSPTLTAGTMAGNAMAAAAGGVAATMAGGAAVKGVGSMLSGGYSGTKSMAGLAGAAIGGGSNVDAHTTPLAGGLRGMYGHLAGPGGITGGIKDSFSRGYQTGEGAVSSNNSSGDGGGSSVGGTNAGGSSSSGSSGGSSGSAGANSASSSSGSGTVHGEGFTMSQPGAGNNTSSTSADSGNASTAGAGNNTQNSEGAGNRENTPPRDAFSQPPAKSGGGSSLGTMAILSQAQQAVPQEAHPSGGMQAQIKHDD